MYWILFVCSWPETNYRKFFCVRYPDSEGGGVMTGSLFSVEPRAPGLSTEPFSSWKNLVGECGEIVTCFTPLCTPYHPTYTQKSSNYPNWANQNARCPITRSYGFVKSTTCIEKQENRCKINANHCKSLQVITYKNGEFPNDYIPVLCMSISFLSLLLWFFLYIKLSKLLNIENQCCGHLW